VKNRDKESVTTSTQLKNMNKENVKTNIQLKNKEEERNNISYNNRVAIHISCEVVKKEIIEKKI
jgi:hypothetical protein